MSKAADLVAAALSSERRLWLAFAAAALVLCGLAFAAHLGGEFVWDDVFLVAQNDGLYRADGARAIATQDLWGQATGRPGDLYHPLPMLTLWLQGLAHGRSLPLFRLVNVLFHALNAFLLLLLLRRLSVGRGAALCLSAVALVHPSVTEPVMWLTGRHDTLAVLFALTALLLWPLEARRAWPRALAASACGALSFWCKEPYVVVPALLLAFHLWAGRALAAKTPPPRVVSVLAPVLPFAALAAAIAWRLHLGISLGGGLPPGGLGRHALDYATVVAHYAAQLLTFSNGGTLALYTPLPAAAAVAVLVLLAGALALAGVVWQRRGAGSLVVLGLAWFALALAPHLVSVPTIGMYANRYGYFALFGSLVAAAGLVGPALVRASERVRGLLALAGAALPVVLILPTFAAAADWATDLKLYGAEVDRDPNNGIAFYHLGYAVQRRQGCEPALPLFERSAQLAPRYPRAFHDLAGCLIDQRRHAEAVAPAREAVLLEPGNARNHYNLALALLNSGQQDVGRAALDKAIALEPTFGPAQRLLMQLKQTGP